MGADGEVTITVTQEGAVRIRVSGVAQVTFEGLDAPTPKPQPQELGKLPESSPTGHTKPIPKPPPRSHLRARQPRAEQEGTADYRSLRVPMRTLLFGTTWAAMSRRRGDS